MKGHVYTSIDNQTYYKIWDATSKKLRSHAAQKLNDVIDNVVRRRVTMYVWHAIDKRFSSPNFTNQK